MRPYPSTGTSKASAITVLAVAQVSFRGSTVTGLRRVRARDHAAAVGAALVGGHGALPPAARSAHRRHLERELSGSPATAKPARIPACAFAWANAGARTDARSKDEDHLRNEGNYCAS